MSVNWSLAGGYWVESILLSGNILKLLLTIAGGNFPIIVVMIPQESGIGASGSLSKNWPRRPRHWYKNFPLKTTEAAHSGIVIILSEWSAHEKFDIGDLLKWVWGVKCWILNLCSYSRLKFLLLWAGLNYCCKSSQVTKDLKVTSLTQYSTRRTRKQARGSWGSAD